MDKTAQIQSKKVVYVSMPHIEGWPSILEINGYLKFEAELIKAGFKNFTSDINVTCKKDVPNSAPGFWVVSFTDKVFIRSSSDHGNKTIPYTEFMKKYVSIFANPKFGI